MKPYKLLLLAILLPFCCNAQTYLDTPHYVPGIPVSWWVNSSYVDTFRNHIIFVAYDAANGSELRTYNGTTSATISTQPGTDNGATPLAENRGFAAVVADTLYFTAMENQSSADRHLYKWDGINSPVKFIDDSLYTYSGVEGLINLDNKLYFVAKQGLASSSFAFEYTPGTGKIRKLPSPPFQTGVSAYRMATHNGKLYISEPVGAWEYAPATDTWWPIHGGIEVKSFIGYGSKIYFLEGPTRSSLFSYDGGIAATDETPSEFVYSGRHPVMKDIIAQNGKLYFWMGPKQTAFGPVRLYNFDTATKLLTPENIQQIDYDMSATYHHHGFLLQHNNNMYISAKQMLIRYNGTKADTVLPFNLATQNMFVYKNELYITGTLNYGNEYTILKFNDSLVNVSVQSIKFAGNLSLYPNPAGNTATLRMNLPSPETLTATITDITGKAVYSTKPTLYSSGESEIYMPLHHLSPGNYFLVVKDSSGNMLWSGKLVHQ